MDGLEDLPNLRRLYLERNFISRLSGVIGCSSLEELSLCRQTHKKEFSFDEHSLATISMSMSTLDLSECGIVDPSALYFLEFVTNLNLKENSISDIDTLVPLLDTMTRLRDLNLIGNPVTKMSKYRDHLVLLSQSLEELDGKSIKANERMYLQNLMAKKRVKLQTKKPDF